MCQSAILDNPEIIVVDCTRSKRIKNILKKYPGIKYVQKVNASYAECKNHGFRKSTGDIIIFMDSDCLIKPDWFYHMKKTLNKKNIDVCTGFTHYPLHGIRHKVLSVLDFLPRQRFQRDDRFLGNNVAVRREVIEKYPFPEGLPDTFASISILCWLWYRHGYKIYFNPRMGIIHTFYPDLLQSHLVRGYDAIAIRQQEPTYPQVAMLKRLKIFFPFIWYLPRVLNDWKYISRSRHLLKVSTLELPLAYLLSAYYRLLDVVGMEIALLYPRYFTKPELKRAY